MTEKNQEVEIDLMQLFQALLRKAWALILAAVIFGGCALGYTSLFVSPTYRARTLMYVNNNSMSLGDTKFSISSGDLAAAQSLVDTYAIILETRSTLDEVKEAANLPYSYEQLCAMIDAGSVNGTEIFYIDVTSISPVEAEKIANTIAQILPGKIASIVDGCSARVVDYAVVPASKASPSVAKNAVLGALVGFVLAAGIVVIQELMDDEIQDVNYLLETYDIPVLAVIPDLEKSGSDKYGYKYGYGSASASAAKGGKKHD